MPWWEWKHYHFTISQSSFLQHSSIDTFPTCPTRDLYDCCKSPQNPLWREELQRITSLLSPSYINKKQTNINNTPFYHSSSFLSSFFVSYPFLLFSQSFSNFLSSLQLPVNILWCWLGKPITRPDADAGDKKLSPIHSCMFTQQFHERLTCDSKRIKDCISPLKYNWSYSFDLIMFWWQ